MSEKAASGREALRDAERSLAAAFTMLFSSSAGDSTTTGQLARAAGLLARLCEERGADAGLANAFSLLQGELLDRKLTERVGRGRDNQASRLWLGKEGAAVEAIKIHFLESEAVSLWLGMFQMQTSLANHHP